MKHIVPEILGEIKAKYEDDPDMPISTYKLILQSYFDDSPVCDIDQEFVMEYDDLCTRMFDLDLFGWEVTNVKDSFENFTSPDNMHEVIGYVLVTITLARVEKGK